MMPPDAVPGQTTPEPADVTSAEMTARPPIHYHWYHKAGAILFVTFCLELGFFLLIFPWTDGWDKFAGFAGKLRLYCDNLYVRGAISGLGIVNLYISLSGMIRLRRFSKRS